MDKGHDERRGKTGLGLYVRKITIKDRQIRNVSPARKLYNYEEYLLLE